MEGWSSSAPSSAPSLPQSAPSLTRSLTHSRIHPNRPRSAPASRSTSKLRELGQQRAPIAPITDGDAVSPGLQQQPPREPERVGAGMRCGGQSWLDKYPATAAGCLALVLGQPTASRCSHTHFVYADLGDRNCACAPLLPAQCDRAGSKDVVAAVVASLYRASPRRGGANPGGGGGGTTGG